MISGNKNQPVLKHFRKIQSAVLAPFRPARPLSEGVSLSFLLARRWAEGYLDRIYFDPSGIVRVVGWSNSELDASDFPSISLDGTSIPFFQSFRYARPDAPTVPGASFIQNGVVLEYLIPEQLAGKSVSLSIDFVAGGNLTFQSEFTFVMPGYRSLVNTPEVLHRRDIYGYGRPATAVHPELLELAKGLNGPVLDFGCGRGTLLIELQGLGVAACGLELNTAIIQESISPHVAASISLYDGSFPTPFKAASFRSVICCEVLEHIPDYEAAIEDMARLATEKLLITVPDISAIPIGFYHGAVPWHLLEGTHVNFFNQSSLEQALRPYFSKIEFGRIGLARFNGSLYYVSLAAICSK